MTKSELYITEKLKGLHKEFPQAAITYEFDSVIETHIIEVLPSNVFDNDAYIEQEIFIKDEFYNAFPNESLTFITENSRVKISKPTLVLKATTSLTVSEVYVEPKFQFSERFFDVFNVDLKEFLTKYEWKTDFALQGSFTTKTSIINRNSFDLTMGLKSNISVSRYLVNDKVESTPPTSLEDCTETQLLAA